MSDKDHPTTEYDDYGSENNYDTGYDDGIEPDGYTSEDYEPGEYESDDNKTGDYALDDYDAEYSDSDSYASDDYDAEDGDPEYYDSEQYAASDYDDAYDQGEYDVESADPATIDPDTIPPEALEPYYDKSAFKWLKNMNRAKLIRLVSMLIFSVAILVFASIAWFTMNKDVGTSGMGVKVGPLPFELKTSGSTGLYDGFLDDTVSGYGSGSTTAESAGIKWKLTSASNVENLYSESGTPTSAQFNEITRSDSEQYGLNPGDSGTLEFSIIPNTPPVSVSFKLEVTGYKASFDSSNYKTDDDLVLVSDSAVNNYKSSHILFFYVGEDNKKHLLTPDGFDVNNISVETSKTLYWVWIPTLQQILDADIEALEEDAAKTASKEVRRYFFENPSYFLKATGTESFTFAVEKQNDINAEEAAIIANIGTYALNGRNYSHYAGMYNDADQTIGDNINYILIELLAGAETSE